MTAEVFNQTETMTEEARREYSRQLEKELFGDVQDNRETVLPSKPKEKKDDKVKLSSHPLKTIFQHKACTDKLYADSFYKVQKNSYSSFEVICCRR